jgi:hypothetical protein
LAASHACIAPNWASGAGDQCLPLCMCYCCCICLQRKRCIVAIPTCSSSTRYREHDLWCGVIRCWSLRHDARTCHSGPAVTHLYVIGSLDHRLSTCSNKTQKHAQLRTSSSFHISKLQFNPIFKHTLQSQTKPTNYITMADTQAKGDRFEEGKENSHQANDPSMSLPLL